MSDVAFPRAIPDETTSDEFWELFVRREHVDPYRRFLRAPTRHRFVVLSCLGYSRWKTGVETHDARRAEMNPAEAIAPDLQRQLTRLRAEVANHRGRQPHDRYARIAVTEAIDTGLEGNAAIGALIVDPGGEVLLVERNRMFVPRFRSDFHAEMVLLTRYEDEHRSRADLRGHTLVTSLEPCEMCTIRIINSGVTNTLYIAADMGKGGITGPNQLAPHWARLAAPQNFAAADCAPRLAEISLESFEATIGGVNRKLMARRLPG